jgi:shikimate kinase
VQGAPSHIVLIGMMGVGKTTVGSLLAERLGYEFWDNDRALRAATGKTAAEIQRETGLQALHHVEWRLLRSALRRSASTVFAAPASVALEPGPLDSAVAVWLRASADREAANIEASGQRHRPLPPDPAAALRDLAAARASAYARLADVIVDVAADPGVTCERVIEALRCRSVGNRSA